MARRSAAVVCQRCMRLNISPEAGDLVSWQLLQALQAVKLVQLKPLFTLCIPLQRQYYTQGFICNGRPLAPVDLLQSQPLQPLLPSSTRGISSCNRSLHADAAALKDSGLSSDSTPNANSNPQTARKPTFPQKHPSIVLKPNLNKPAANQSAMPTASSIQVPNWKVIDTRIKVHKLDSKHKPDSSPSVPAILPQLPPYVMLKAAHQAQQQGKPLYTCPAIDKGRIGKLLCDFVTNAESRGLECYVSPQLYPQAAAAFRRFMLRALVAPLRDNLVALGPKYSSQVEDILFGYFKEFVEQTYPNEISTYMNTMRTVDLRAPHTWYPYARAIQRRIIYHAGPTNSGKTHNAIETLKKAPRGLYCGPLRLLALEIYDRLNHDGVYCSLLTGEDRRTVPGATHIAATVEMVQFMTHLDVAVIDEIQMVADPDRGWAWTRALLGLPANEIHLCGDKTALPLIQKMCKDTGDELLVHEYGRFSELVVEPTALTSLADVKPGDCFIAFSKKIIFELKAKIERLSRLKLRTCVVYGSLPPETRKHQAKLFNDPKSGFDVMVASDAVGMGLNLNIRRIVFSTLKKPGPSKTSAELTPSAIKQIAGRAGRRSSTFQQGYVTAMTSADLITIRQALHQPMAPAKAAGLYPEYEQIEVLAASMPGATLVEVLMRFAKESRLDERYFFCTQPNTIAIAMALEQVPTLSLRDRYTFCMAPIRSDSPPLLAWLVSFARTRAAGRPCMLTKFPIPDRLPQTLLQLQKVEELHQVVLAWLWLSYRFEEGAFPGRDHAMDMYNRVIDILNDSLASETGIKLPPKRRLVTTAAATPAKLKPAATLED